jgi:hypothetical protein
MTRYTFEENQILFMQDMSFYKGIPPLDFEVRVDLTENCTLFRPGYGMPGFYGNGAIHVKVQHMDEPLRNFCKENFIEILEESFNESSKFQQIKKLGVIHSSVLFSDEFPELKNNYHERPFLMHVSGEIDRFDVEKFHKLLKLQPITQGEINKCLWFWRSHTRYEGQDPWEVNKQRGKELNLW